MALIAPTVLPSAAAQSRFVRTRRPSDIGVGSIAHGSVGRLRRAALSALFEIGLDDRLTDRHGRRPHAPERALGERRWTNLVPAVMSPFPGPIHRFAVAIDRGPVRI